MGGGDERGRLGEGLARRCEKIAHAAASLLLLPFPPLVDESLIDLGTSRQGTVIVALQLVCRERERGA